MKIQKKEYQIQTKINKKICHISDIHFSKQYPVSILKPILESIKEYKPDYICITGDLLDAEEVSKLPLIETFYTFLKALGKCAPVICILGNHDVTNIRKQKRKYEKATSFRMRLKRIPHFFLLENSIYEDNWIRFIGYEQEPSLFEKELKKEKEVQKEIEERLPHQLSRDKSNILLIHSPILIGKENFQKKLELCESLDLILSGHTHDGVVLPFLEKIYPENRGIISPNKKWFPSHVRGMLKMNVPVIINGALIKLSAKTGFLHYLNGIFPSSLTFIEFYKEK